MRSRACFTSLMFAVLSANAALGQSLGNAGTIEGLVADQSGGVIGRAAVTIYNPVTGYRQSVISGADGVFRLVNIPPNQYHLEVTAPAFNAFVRDISIRNSLPVQ